MLQLHNTSHSIYFIIRIRNNNKQRQGILIFGIIIFLIKLWIQFNVTPAAFPRKYNFCYYSSTQVLLLMVYLSFALIK